MQFTPVAGEAMHHGPADAVARSAQHGDEILVRVALVQEQRLARFDSQRELAFEGEALGLARRVVAVVVQPGLAGGPHVGLAQQRAQEVLGLRRVVRGMVRVHAGRGVEDSRMGARQGQRRLRAFRAGPGDHDLRHARGTRPRQHGGQVVAEGLMGEVGADVNEGHGAALEGGGRLAPAAC